MSTLAIEQLKASDLPGQWGERLKVTPGQTITVRIEIEPSGSETTETFATDDPAFGIWRDRDEAANHLLTGNPVEDSPLANSRLFRRVRTFEPGRSGYGVKIIDSIIAKGRVEAALAPVDAAA